MSRPSDAGHDSDPLAATVAPASAGTEPTLASDGGAAEPPPTGLPVVRAQHYQIERELSRGGMGRILVAHDRRIGRPVAIKEATIGSALARARFEREALITGRLQHPGIVPVYEAGQWPDGESFYAMKLVDGRPLRKCIDDATTLAGRIALLPNVVAVADALAYAHSRRVIHRDLKPDNVLVGDYGETIVIDWGLAKQLDAADDDVEVEAIAPATAEQTVAGSMVGTPVYMPPEQARGEPADERSDVYAIGAMLYHLLGGKVPYGDSRSTMEVIERVMKGPPRAIGELVADAPVDLIAIVDKAMAREPGDRYPSARELADDLRRYTTGQLVGAHRYSRWQLIRRWVARNRTPVIVAAVLLTVLAVTSTLAVRQIVAERDEARAQRALADQRKAEADRRKAEADTRRAAAEELVGFMVVDLRDKLLPLGKLDVMAGLGATVLGYYAKVEAADDDATNDELLRRAKALVILGGVELEKGNLEAAQGLLEASRKVAEELLVKAPGNLEALQNLAVAYERLGTTAEAQGGSAAARPHFDRHLALMTTVAAEAPDAPGVQRSLGIAHMKVGENAFNTGQTAEALREFEATLAIFEKIDATAPSSESKQAVAMVLRKLGDTHLQLGKLSDAIPDYERAIAIGKDLVAADPSNVPAARALAIAIISFGDVLTDSGNIPDGIARYQDGLAMLQRLSDADPANLKLQEFLAVAHNRVGDAERLREHHADALRSFLASLAIAQRLVAKAPDSARWHSDLGASWLKVGDAQQTLGKLDAARRAYQAGLAEYEGILAADGSPEWRVQIAIAHSGLGYVASAEGKRADAIAAFRRSLAIHEELAKASPDSADQAFQVAVAQLQLGDALRLGDQRDDAIASMRAGLAGFEALLAAEPTHNRFRYRVAEASHELAKLLGDGAEADTLLARALGLLDALAAENQLAPGELERRAQVKKATGP